MERHATACRRMHNVENRFERSRLFEEVMALAYERLVPVVRRTTGRSQKCCMSRSGGGRQPVRRAS